ncbi:MULTISPECIES: DedA family protein [unclassified Paenibacillus]|uniref:DedA family protein n=1 Tax=unclassified Paenibacillus TaxID=185978 RepID=UPI00093000F9|nr:MULTISPECIES: DedA family protein [unclassified Paenibacillus]
MDYSQLTDWIEHLGYAALFFSLWLGIVGMPIPDEVIVMTGGAVTSAGLLHAVPAFLLTYLGVISGLSLGYVLGRYIGAPVLGKLQRKKNMTKYLRISEQLIEKHGNAALSFSYFLPVVRHVVPYLVGINKMSFWRYAGYSYTTGFVWTLIFFVLGRFVGQDVPRIGMLIYRYGIYVMCAVVLLAAIYAVTVFLRGYSRGKS